MAYIQAIRCLVLRSSRKATCWDYTKSVRLMVETFMGESMGYGRIG